MLHFVWRKGHSGNLCRSYELIARLTLFSYQEKRLSDGKRCVPFNFRIDLNGEKLLEANGCTMFLNEDERIYPAISTSGNQSCAFNFGYQDFKYVS